jgi:6-phosphogluconolactonase (cycloisomerase 2 family)
MLFLASLILLGAASASASTLFIAEHSGKVTSVQLKYDINATKYNFENATPYDGCGANPSWLTVDSGRGVLYCLDEAIRDGTTGGPTSYSIKKDGSLVKVQSATGLKGSVSAAVVGEPTEQQALIVANFVGGSISTFLLKCNGDFSTTPQQTIPLNGSEPADQQKSSHPHQALVDPTGQYVLVPDFGMDQVHVFSWDQTSHNLAALAPLQVKPPGSGPRHGVFWNPSGVACDTCPTYLFLVSETTSRVTSYRVTYLPDGKGLTFNMVDASPTTDYFALPPVISTAAGVTSTRPGVNYPAEVVISVSSTPPNPRHPSK